MPNKATSEIIDRLEGSISDDVGSLHDNDIDVISAEFNKMVDNALKTFNSSVFDDNGFLRKLRDMELDGKRDQTMMKNVLNSIQSDYKSIESINGSELLLRRDIDNICAQMPEMRDALNVVRDAIIECNVSTGQVSRSIVFENREDTDSYESIVKEVEEKHNLLMANKNFITPNTLRAGEFCTHIVPYSKLFAELEAIRDSKSGNRNNHGLRSQIQESTRSDKSLCSKENINMLMESVSHVTKVDTSDINRIENPDVKVSSNIDTYAETNISCILKNIDVCSSSSLILSELGEEGVMKILQEGKATQIRSADAKSNNKETHFMEEMGFNVSHDSIYQGVNQDDIDLKGYEHIKGCYVKYLDPLRTIPIRMDRRVIGYYYVTTTADVRGGSGQGKGIVDLSLRHYTHDNDFVDSLASMIIQSFDKKMLEKNIKLKNEIVEIIMAHKFSEGKLSFVYIPEDEIVRFVINEDENGRGHSMLEPSIFPARMYLMLTMYNMLYTLNNNITRIHYVKSSGLNKDYSSQVQRAMRKFQSTRVTVDDIFSYAGAMDKIGGMGEMVLPAGRSDVRAFETDTIEPVANPIDIQFLEQMRRQALAGTGVPHLLVINAIDEVDFAKTLEMANARFLSTVSSYKIDFNRGYTLLYRKILKYETTIPDDIIESFRFQFNTIKQQDLVITAEMIQNFNSLVEMVQTIFYMETDMKDDKGNPTDKQKHLRRELAREYLPQLEIDNLEKVVERVDIAANEDVIKRKAKGVNISDQDLGDIDKNE